MKVTMELGAVFPKQSRSYMLLLTEYTWEFQNIAMWDTF